MFGYKLITMKSKRILFITLLSVPVFVFSQCKQEKIKDFELKSETNKRIPLKERSAYRSLAKYYRLTCECSKGTKRSEELIALINRIVDVNRKYHHNKYATLNKVTTCKSL